jgi:nucleotide-binding universal stress UspA family protein
MSVSIKVVLAPVTGEKSETVALTAGLDLANRFNGHLRAVHIRPSADDKSPLPRDLIKVLSGKAAKAVIKEAEEQALSQAKLAKELFSAFCKANDVKTASRPGKTEQTTGAWEEKKGDPYHVIPIVGRMADLVVICRPHHKLDNNTGRFIKAALFDTGSPLLLVPRTPTKTLGKRIAIAWDRSAAAKRAVIAALPLMADAEAVRIISVGEPDKLGPSAQHLATYLKWHGVDTDIVTNKILKKAPEAELEDAFKDFNADLVVMGAYTRSRLQQRIFGGVTRTMLNLKNLPVLFHV